MHVCVWIWNVNVMKADEITSFFHCRVWVCVPGLIPILLLLLFLKKSKKKMSVFWIERVRMRCAHDHKNTQVDSQPHEQIHNSWQLKANNLCLWLKSCVLSSQFFFQCFPRFMCHLCRKKRRNTFICAHTHSHTLVAIGPYRPILLHFQSMFIGSNVLKDI